MSAQSKIWAAGLLVVTAVATAAFMPAPRVALAASTSGPTYNDKGELQAPANYREWVFLTSGIDMSYSPKAEMAGSSMFDNVFVNPEAYRSFMVTGTWPDKTMLVMEARGAQTKGSINKSGHFQSVGVMDMEVHVKDEARFKGKWAFFSFDGAKGNGTLIPQGAPCYTCHQAHAAVDTTFVQFYPTLLPVAHEKRTLSAEFLKDEAEHRGGK